MRIVVTGGNGFIGSHVVDLLVDAGHDVVVIDSWAPGAHAVEPEWRNPAAEHRRQDITDPDAWLDALDGADAVSHQAARVGLGVDFADVRAYVADNDVGTATGLWAMHQSEFRGRLVIASSMVVYGEGAYECPLDGPVRPAPRRREDLEAGRFEPPCPRCGGPLAPTLVGEDAPIDPRNVYAATKVHTEHLAFAFGREHDVAVTALRYHNVYGPRMPRDTPYAGVASLFRSALAAGRVPEVYEDGGQRRDFVHVDDVARANVLALTTAEPYDGALNVCSGQPVTILDMAGALTAAFDGSRQPVVTGRFRLGDVRHVVADPARARAALGFTAAVGPREGLAAFAHAPLRGAAAEPVQR